LPGQADSLLCFTVGKYGCQGPARGGTETEGYWEKPLGSLVKWPLRKVRTVLQKAYRKDVAVPVKKWETTEQPVLVSRLFTGMPPIQQARELLAALHLEGSKFSVECELIHRLERTYGLKIAVTTCKLSGRGLTGATIRAGDTLIIVCPEEGGGALREPVIAHEVAHEVRGDPVIDLEAVIQALDTSPDLSFVICDPETELQAECTAAAIVMLARKPDSRKRRALRRIGAAIFGQAPGHAQNWKNTPETLTQYFDLDR